VLPLFIDVTIYTDVGRSCILLTIGGKNLMLDCGMHMGYNDDVSNKSAYVFYFLFLCMNKQFSLLGCFKFV